MTAATELVVTAPGEVDEAWYHSHPALSYSGAKMLLPPSCPAKFAYYRVHGRPDKAEFDLGHAAHRELLGIGPDIAPIPGDWRTKKAQEAIKVARALGEVPLKPDDAHAVTEMVKALAAHPFAGKLFDPFAGMAEHPLFWTDPDTGIDLRCRPDFIRTSGDRTIIVDYKTCVDANTEACRRAIWNYRYMMQNPWYVEGVKACDLGGDDTGFAFVFQEKTPPYLVNVIWLDDDFYAAGQRLNRQAREIFRDCTQAGVWPGYAADIETVSLPPWAARELDL